MAFVGAWARDTLRARDTLIEAVQVQRWPENMVVRLGADVHLRGGTTFKEDWEFSESEVHRIRIVRRGSTIVVRQQP